MKRNIGIGLMLMLLMCACNHKELCYHHPHTGRVRINVDWSEFDREQPTGMSVMVFPAEGGQPHGSLTHTLDHATFDLPAGNYHTMTFNQSPSEFGSVSFEGMDGFGEARVMAKRISSRWYKGRSGNEVTVTDPEWIAVDSDTDNRVTEEMVEATRHEQMMENRQLPLTEHLLTTHTPRNVVYTVHVKMHLRGIHNLRSARAALDGWAEGVRLSTSQPLAGKVTHLMESWKLTQDKDDPMKGYITATFHCFGFPQGHQELPEENKFMPSLLLVDNKTQLERTFPVGNLFECDKEDNQILYLELDWGDPLPDVKPEGGSSSGFDAYVEDWGEEIEHEIEM